jgi:hypothetical protein
MVAYPLAVLQQRGWEACEVEPGLLKPSSRSSKRAMQARGTTESRRRSSNVSQGVLSLFGTVAVDDARTSGDRKRGADQKAEQAG